MFPIQFTLFSKHFSVPVHQIIHFVYLIFSVFYSYERILNTDNSMYFFQLINRETFVFPEHRYGVFLSQIPLLTGIWLGLGLKSLVFFYSITFPILYWAIAWLCMRIFHMKEAGLIISLLLVSGVGFSFFHPVTETYQAMVYAVLVYAVLSAGYRNIVNKPVYFVSLILAVGLCILSHPISLFLILYVAVIAKIQKTASLKQIILLTLVCFITGIVRMSFAAEGSYDSKQYDQLLHSSSAIVNFIHLQPLRFLAVKSISTYLPVVVMIGSSLYFIKRLTRSNLLEAKLMLIFSLFAAASLTLISLLTFSKGDSDMMLEKAFLPSVFFIIFAFVFILRRCETKIRNFVLLPLIIAFIGFSRIIYVGIGMTDRLTILKDVAHRNQEHPKLIASYKDFNSPAIRFYHWATAIDVLILSSCELEKPVTLFLTDSKEAFVADKQDNQLFLCVDYWPYWNTSQLNKRYFKLSNVPYEYYAP